MLAVFSALFFSFEHVRLSIDAVVDHVRSTYWDGKLGFHLSPWALLTIDGILIETPEFIGRFDIKTQWAVEAQLLVTHHVDYRVIDREFLAASDDMMLWEQFTVWDQDQQKDNAVAFTPGVKDQARDEKDRISSRPPGEDMDGNCNKLFSEGDDEAES